MKRKIDWAWIGGMLMIAAGVGGFFVGGLPLAAGAAVGVGFICMAIYFFQQLFGR